MCKFCNREPKFSFDGGFYEDDNSNSIAEGGWTELRIGVDRYGKLIMYGAGDGNTDFYYPKYCPECGQDLRKENEDG